MEYLEFELEVGEEVEGLHPVSVLRSPAGEASAHVRLPALDGELAQALAQGRDVLPDPARPASAESLRQFGQALFDAVFASSVRARFDATLHQAHLNDKGVRISLRLRSASVARLPWELLYDKEREHYVALSSTTTLSRYVDAPSPVKSLAVNPPLRVLAVLSTPSDIGHLDAAEEQRRVGAATGTLTSSGQIEIEWLKGADAQIGKVQERLRDARPWHVLHFIGHGTFDHAAREGAIALTDDSGRARWVGARALGLLLRDHPSLRLAVLNCCRSAQSSESELFSSTAARIAHNGLPAVVAMQTVVSDKSAIAFAGEFYGVIAAGGPVETAVSEGRKAMSLHAQPGELDWALPVLHLRSANGQLFALATLGQWKLPKWYSAAFAAVASVATILAALPCFMLWREQPQFFTDYIQRYPALFLFFGFLGLAFVALYQPTGQLLKGLLRQPLGRAGWMTIGVSAFFLAVFPIYAVYSERHKLLVAPWEVVSTAGLPPLSGVDIPGFNDWPRQFFAISNVAQPLPLDQIAQNKLHNAYKNTLDNKKLLTGELKISRTGIAHYFAVAATALAIVILLLDITLLVIHWRRSPTMKTPVIVFRGLTCAFACLVIWLLMRLSTAQVDAMVFGELPGLEQLLPSVIATIASVALVIVGLKDVMKAEWLTLLGVVMGPLSLVGIYSAREQIAALFSDPRMLGACFILALPVVIFSLSAREDA